MNDIRDDWKLAWEQAMSIPLDDSTVDDQEISAAIMRQQMEMCAAAVPHLRYYATLAFKGDEELAVFGFERIYKVSNSPTTYAIVARTLHGLANTYSHQLTDKGMTPAQTQALLDSSALLIDAEVRHEM